MADKIKWLFAVLILVGGLTAFYMLSDQPQWARLLGILVAFAISGAIALQTTAGANAWNFGRGAWIEIRKVVWPTRKETTQTTLMVILMVVFVGLILWGFDMFLTFAVERLTRQGG